jgi:hypothetical protein
MSRNKNHKKETLAAGYQTIISDIVQVASDIGGGRLKVLMGVGKFPSATLRTRPSATFRTSQLPTF